MPFSEAALWLLQQLLSDRYWLTTNGSKYLPKDFKWHQNYLGEHMNVRHATNKLHVAKICTFPSRIGQWLVNNSKYRLVQSKSTFSFSKLEFRVCQCIKSYCKTCVCTIQVNLHKCRFRRIEV